MYQMTEEEKATREEIKKLHRAVRPRYVGADRYNNLLWGFVRGFPYRRIERKCYVQTLSDGSTYEHNRPSEYVLARMAIKAGMGDTELAMVKRFQLWLEDSEGAIPAPPPRVKKVYDGPYKKALAAE